MARQTTVSALPNKLLAGQLTDGFKYPDQIDGILDQATSVSPGLVAIRGTGGDRAAIVVTIAALVSSIKTNIGSTAGTQALTTADFNGSIGASRIAPAAKLVMVFSSHTDWDASTVTITGYDENDLPITDTIAIPNNGNATVLSSLYFSRVLTVALTAQTGTGGTATLGTSASVTFDGGDFLGVIVHSHKALVSPAEDDNEKYEQHMTMPLLAMGRIGMPCENAWRAGGHPLVRIAAGTGTVIGGIRSHDTDSSTCVVCKRLRFVNSGTATGLDTIAEVEVIKK